MNKIRTEQILYLLAFLMALGIRLLNLGDAPLSDFEAGWALQSLALAGGESVVLGAQPGYIFSTLMLFELFGTANFLARLWPALAGSLLVLAPYAFRDQLGQKAAVILAFGFVFDPGMTALSRLAGLGGRELRGRRHRLDGLDGSRSLEGVVRRGWHHGPGILLHGLLGQRAFHHVRHRLDEDHETLIRRNHLEVDTRELNRVPVLQPTRHLDGFDGAEEIPDVVVDDVGLPALEQAERICELLLFPERRVDGDPPARGFGRAGGVIPEVVCAGDGGNRRRQNAQPIQPGAGAGIDNDHSFRSLDGVDVAAVAVDPDRIGDAIPFHGASPCRAAHDTAAAADLRSPLTTPPCLLSLHVASRP